MKPPPIRNVHDLTKPPLRALKGLHDLLKVPRHKRDRAYWHALRQWRDEALEALRGPFDKRVLRILIGRTPHWVSADPQWQESLWAGALVEMEAFSTRLDIAYANYVLERQTFGRRGTA